MSSVLLVVLSTDYQNYWPTLTVLLAEALCDLRFGITWLVL